MKMLFLVLAIALCVPSVAQVPAQPVDISPLLIGEQIPNTTLHATDGTSVQLMSKIQTKPTVLIFYRGGWCPYCNAHLGALQEIESDILAAGYQIIAISPDSPDQLKASVEKNHLKYTLLSDATSTASTAFGIAFQAPEGYKETLKKSSGGLNKGYLPVPSVFVVDQTGMIVFEYISPSYKQRISGKLLLQVLRTLDTSDGDSK